MPQFKNAVQLKPQDGSLRGNLAIAYIQMADFDAAVSGSRCCVRIAPASASLHYDLGLAYKLKDQLDKAAAEFQEAIRLQPDLTDAHYTLGILYWQRGEFDKAAAETRAAIENQSNYAEAHYMLGTILKQQESYRTQRLNCARPSVCSPTSQEHIRRYVAAARRFGWRSARSEGRGAYRSVGQ